METDDDIPRFVERKEWIPSPGSVAVTEGNSLRVISSRSSHEINSSEMGIFQSVEVMTSKEGSSVDEGSSIDEGSSVDAIATRLFPTTSSSHISPSTPTLTLLNSSSVMSRSSTVGVTSSASYSCVDDDVTSVSSVSQVTSSTVNMASVIGSSGVDGFTTTVTFVHGSRSSAIDVTSVMGTSHVDGVATTVASVTGLNKSRVSALVNRFESSSPDAGRNTTGGNSNTTYLTGSKSTPTNLTSVISSSSLKDTKSPTNQDSAVLSRSRAVKVTAKQVSQTNTCLRKFGQTKKSATSRVVSSALAVIGPSLARDLALGAKRPTFIDSDEDSQGEVSRSSTVVRSRSTKATERLVSGSSDGDKQATADISSTDDNIDEEDGNVSDVIKDFFTFPIDNVGGRDKTNPENTCPSDSFSSVIYIPHADHSSPSTPTHEGARRLTPGASIESFPTYTSHCTISKRKVADIEKNPKIEEGIHVTTLCTHLPKYNTVQIRNSIVPDGKDQKTVASFKETEVTSTSVEPSSGGHSTMGAVGKKKIKKKRGKTGIQIDDVRDRVGGK